MTAHRIGIVGYGNLGRGVGLAVTLQEDMELVGVFTRRDPSTVTTALEGTTVRSVDALESMTDEINVLVLCGGSRSDLPEQTPQLAARFTVVDSFDTHARIPEHCAAVDAAAREAGTTALISTGWDPGLFSINRLFGEAILASGDTYTFWGRGLSQGHSDAVRRVDGVAAGVQYTIPSEDAIARVRAGERPELSTREKHVRECFVVLEEGADAEAVREEIVTMPHYFEPYDTTVHSERHPAPIPRGPGRHVPPGLSVRRPAGTSIADAVRGPRPLSPMQCVSHSCEPLRGGKHRCEQVCSSLVAGRQVAHGGRSSVGRAPGCGPGGRGFKSRRSPQETPW